MTAEQFMNYELESNGAEDFCGCSLIDFLDDLGVGPGTTMEDVNKILIEHGIAPIPYWESESVIK